MRRSRAPSQSRKRPFTRSNSVNVKRTRVETAASADKGAYTTRVPTRTELKKISVQYPAQPLPQGWFFFEVGTPAVGSNDDAREGRAIRTKYMQLAYHTELTNAGEHQQMHYRVVVLAWRNPLNAPLAGDIFDYDGTQGFLSTYSAKMAGQYTILSDKIHMIRKNVDLAKFATDLQCYTVKNEGLMTFYGAATTDVANVKYYVAISGEIGSVMNTRLRTSLTFVDI